MGFQSQVNIMPAPAVEGDFASANPRASVLAGPNALVTGSNTPVGQTQAGVLVGRFAWASAATGVSQVSGEIDGLLTVNSNGAGTPTGFVHREQQALITVFLGQATQLVPTGLPITLFNEGEFWVRNASNATSSIGQNVFAINATGAVWPATGTTPPTDATLTTITIVANTANVSAAAVNSFTGTIGLFAVSGQPTAQILNVTAVSTGGLFPNQTLTGTNVAAGTAIISQLTGTAGSTGQYLVNIAQTVNSTTITGSGGWWTVTSMTNGAVFVGQTWSGGTNAFTTGTTILAGGTGTGGAGTYPLSIAQTLASTATATGSGAYMNVTAVTGTINIGDAAYTGGAHTANVTKQYSGTTGGIGAYFLSNATGVGDTSGVVYAGTLTKWDVLSVAAPGELMKIGTWPLG